MKYSFVLLALFLSGAVLASSKPVVYTEDTLSITATPATQQFVIQLKSNATTGYSWFLSQYNANLIAPVNHIFKAATSQLVGAPGWEIWTFRIKPAGFAVPQQTRLSFVYARPWDSSGQAKYVIFKVSTLPGSTSHPQIPT